LAGGAIPS